jgi:large subunit ribosomal protein L15
MKPHELKAPDRARKRAKRVGRGEGSGRGKTAGRGTKGTRARGTIKGFFEGGQMPLTRRVPKLKGFKPPSRRRYATINVSDLAGIESAEVGPEQLEGAGLVHKRFDAIKLLGKGELDRKVTIRVHAVSESARSKVESAGGSVHIIDSDAGAPK